MKFELSAQEARVIGCLMEKAVTTPDQYPLTLNSLTNACNQKSNRDPVMTLSKGEVGHTARGLEDKFLIGTIEVDRRGVEKYRHRFCNTPLGEIQLSEAEYAIVCLLLLRGPQTPGELRSRSGRLHAFEDNEDASDALKGLMEREGGPLVARLPRIAGRRDSEYMHLFSGEIESAPEPSGVATRPHRDSRTGILEARVAALEVALIDLARRLGEDIELGPGSIEDAAGTDLLDHES